MGGRHDRVFVESAQCAAGSTRPAHDRHHLDRPRLEDLRLGLPRARRRQPRHPRRRDLRPARPERRRQDDADRHRLRHRQAGPGQRQGRRPRHRRRLSQGARPDRPGAAGADHRRVRDRVGDGLVQPRPVRQGAEPGLHREDAQGAVALGQEGQQDHDALGRHEAPGDDRQGAGARAARALPRRADRRRRRRPAPGDVAAGARPARLGRDDRPDDALHRRGRGHGRPRRRHPPGQDHPGRGQGDADAKARQEAADAAARAAAGAAAAAARRDQRPDAGRRRRRAQLRLRPGQRYDAVPALLEALRGSLPEAGVRVKDLETTQSSLEEIFVSLVRE